MTPQEMRTELIRIAAELVRGLHAEDIVFSKTTPWYVRARVEKVIDAADERSKILAMQLKKVADALIPALETSERPCGCPTTTAGRAICEERYGATGTYCLAERQQEVYEKCDIGNCCMRAANGSRFCEGHTPSKPQHGQHGDDCACRDCTRSALNRGVTP